MLFCFLLNFLNQNCMAFGYNDQSNSSISNYSYIFDSIITTTEILSSHIIVTTTVATRVDTIVSTNVATTVAPLFFLITIYK